MCVCVYFPAQAAGMYKCEERALPLSPQTRQGAVGNTPDIFIELELDELADPSSTLEPTVVVVAITGHDALQLQSQMICAVRVRISLAGSEASLSGALRWARSGQVDAHSRAQITAQAHQRSLDL